jgi:bifunctional UDP-N-acetylglucosamine pyrophosphorylase/glucosamine-1-phosphate N-acetyltransferase
MRIKDKIVDTGRRKLGVILGDNVKTGINSTFLPGVKVGNDSWIGVNVMIERDVEPNTIVALKQVMEKKKKEKKPKDLLS